MRRNTPAAIDALLIAGYGLAKEKISPMPARISYAACRPAWLQTRIEYA
jgi:hypothetical protein